MVSLKYDFRQFKKMEGGILEKNTHYCPAFLSTLLGARDVVPVFFVINFMGCRESFFYLKCNFIPSCEATNPKSS